MLFFLKGFTLLIFLNSSFRPSYLAKLIRKYSTGAHVPCSYTWPSLWGTSSTRVEHVLLSLSLHGSILCQHPRLMLGVAPGFKHAINLDRFTLIFFPIQKSFIKLKIDFSIQYILIMILPPLPPPRPVPLYPPKFMPFFLFLIRMQSSKITTTKISTTTLD